MRIQILIFFAFLGFSQQSYAQQDPMFTKYMFNSLVFNPAYAGSHEHMSVRLLYRDQWLDIEGAPTTQSFTIHTPMSERIGLGLSVINDKIGVHGTTSANFAYAYRFQFGSGKLSIGLQGGAMNFRSNFNNLTYREPQATDNSFNEIVPNQWLINFGGGLFYYAPKFYLGFSVPKLLNQNLKRTNATSVGGNVASTYRHYYFTAGAAIPISGDALIFKPSLLVKSVGLFGAFADNSTVLRRIGAPTEYDIDLSFMFYETLWVGASFRSAIEKLTNNTSSNDSVDIWASVYLNNGMRIGAAYDYIISKIGNQTKGSFEVMLGYDFSYDEKRVNHPRYF